MVLQRGPQRAVVWGTASTIGDVVTVTVSGHGHATGHVANDGTWKVKLPAITEHGPFTITAKSSEGHVTLTDVLFGDVWVCSGQSNMGFSLNHVINASQEIATASKFHNIRIFRATTVQSPTPLQDLKSVSTHWSLPNSNSLPHFSAVCWLYAEYLYPHVNHPIGLVDTAWGGTPVEAWSSPDALGACAAKQKRGPGGHSVLWNAMINPFLHMTIYGAIWYQGESNAGHPDAYACQFPAMIRDWRKKFHDASLRETHQNFPFGFVQIAANAHNLHNVGGFPPLRWAQTAKVGHVPNHKMPNTFMAVALDLPDFHSPYGTIHPRYKQDVCHRLVLGALAVAYHRKNIEYQGPFPSAFTEDKSKHHLTIEYDNGRTPIEVRDTKNGFDICCSAHATTCGAHDHWLVAPVTHSDTSSVTLSTSGCTQHVVGLRYEWRTSPCEFKKCAIYGRDNDLPAPPFIRTTAF
ncbi:sialate O-acetylesterase-like isoform X2 [Gigantopelta aegis]|nr:sialate O-acetylesterase-like isoform X2 [Gigantopelta aegis]XP_041361502.1 sialate O-acetylesterase-like isoform X2 [Gigantopelta aegis]